MLQAIKNSLGAKVVIAVVGVLAVFITTLGVIDMQNETAEIMNTYRRNAKVLALTIEKGLISAMKEGRSKDLQKSLDEVGTQEEVLGVRIFDEKGTILRSTNRGEIGGSVDKKKLDALAVTQEGGGTEGGDDAVFSFLKPIYNTPECYGCHSPGKRVNGVLDVEISLKEANQEIAGNRRFMFKWGLLTILCVALAEILLLRYLVTRPVGELRSAMKKAEKGDDFSLRERYDDELGELGHAFRAMLARIQDLNGRVIENEKDIVRHQETLKAQNVLSAVIDGMPDGVAIIDREMNLLQTNPRHRELFPRAKIGEPCYFSMHGRNSVCPHCGVARVFDDGKVHEHHSTITMPNGLVKVVHSISAPIPSEDGSVSKVVEVIRDVTERVTLEKELKEKGWELERVNQKLAKMAVTDGLTMLFNRRYFQDSLSREFKRLARHRALPLLALAMVDIDDFKQLNDTHGHQAGDLVLKNLAKILKTCIRVTDVVARYGGEEFVVIIPETDAEGASVVAERIRQGVEAATFLYRDATLKVTVSVGLASFPLPDVNTEEDLIKAADVALYKAKAEGKNRVVLAT